MGSFCDIFALSKGDDVTAVCDVVIGLPDEPVLVGEVVLVRDVILVREVILGREVIVSLLKLLHGIFVMLNVVLLPCSL